VPYEFRPCNFLPVISTVSGCEWREKIQSYWSECRIHCAPPGKGNVDTVSVEPVRWVVSADDFLGSLEEILNRVLGGFLDGRSGCVVLRRSAQHQVVDSNHWSRADRGRVVDGSELSREETVQIVFCQAPTTINNRLTTEHGLATEPSLMPRPPPPSEGRRPGMCYTYSYFAAYTTEFGL